jgi:hypothetical protein
MASPNPPVPPAAPMPPIAETLPVGPTPSPATTAPSDNGKDRLDFLWKVHGYTNDYIRFADSKAAFVAATVIVLIGALVASRVFDSFGGTLPARIWWAFGALALLLLSFLFALWAIKPRLHSTTPKGYIYWGSVIEHKEDLVYAMECGKLTSADLEMNVSRHIYTLAGICHHKYFWTNLAMLTGSAGGILAGSVVLVTHILPLK